MKTILDDYLAISIDIFSRVIGQAFTDKLRGLDSEGKLLLILAADNFLALEAAKRGNLGDRYMRKDGGLVCNAANISASFTLWSKEKRFYKIAEDFGLQLYKTGCSFLTKHLVALPLVCLIVQFPESLKMVLKNGNVARAMTFTRVPNGISFLFHEYTVDNKYTGQSDYYFMSFDRPEIQDLLEKEFTEVVQNDISTLAATLGEDKGDATAEIISFAVKSIIYIFSANPDLREYKPLPTGKDLVRRERDRNVTENEKNGKWPMMLVGYDWKKPIQYHVDSTTVSGHFRWQPCGKNKENVKLIWIDEHHRSFNKE